MGRRARLLAGAHVAGAGDVPGERITALAALRSCHRSSPSRWTRTATSRWIRLGSRSVAPLRDRPDHAVVLVDEVERSPPAPAGRRSLQQAREPAVLEHAPLGLAARAVAHHVVLVVDRGERASRSAGTARPRGGAPRAASAACRGSAARSSARSARARRRASRRSRRAGARAPPASRSPPRLNGESSRASRGSRRPTSARSRRSRAGRAAPRAAVARRRSRSPRSAGADRPRLGAEARERLLGLERVERQELDPRRLLGAELAQPQLAAVGDAARAGARCGRAGPARVSKSCRRPDDIRCISSASSPPASTMICLPRRRTPSIGRPGERVERRREALQRVDPRRQRRLDLGAAQRAVQAARGDLDLGQLGHPQAYAPPPVADRARISSRARPARRVARASARRRRSPGGGGPPHAPQPVGREVPARAPGAPSRRRAPSCSVRQVRPPSLEYWSSIVVGAARAARAAPLAVERGHAAARAAGRAGRPGRPRRPVAPVGPLAPVAPVDRPPSAAARGPRRRRRRACASRRAAGGSRCRPASPRPCRSPGPTEAAGPSGGSSRSRYWSKETTRGFSHAIFSEIAWNSACWASDTPSVWLG